MNKDMARRNTPLAYTPTGPIYEDDLNYRLGERARVAAGYALAFLVVLLFVVLMSLAQ